MNAPRSEADAVRERYARRPDAAQDARYRMLNPAVWQSVHERQRALLGLFARAGLEDLSALRLLEVGCGSGGNLLELLRLGFRPEHLSGAELLPERLAASGLHVEVALLDTLTAPAADRLDFLNELPLNDEERARLRSLAPATVAHLPVFIVTARHVR